MAPRRPSRAVNPTEPIGAAIELALADRGGGLFLRGWVRDPLGMVLGMELRSGIVRRELPLAALQRVTRPDLSELFDKAAFGGGGPTPGFLAHLPDADHPAVAQWRLALRLGSGEAVELTAPPAEFRPAVARDLVLQAVAPGALRPGLLADCIAPAAARLQRAAMADAGPTDVIRLGPVPRRPRAAIIVPLYRNLRFLRFQLAAFARDAALREVVEVIYVLDSPEQRGEVEHALRGMAALHPRIGIVLVVMPENRGYASACNAGAAVTQAPVLALLNSDVVPVARGWLDALLRRLGQDRRLAAVGPKLLFDDGSIQHAGLLFRRGEDGLWLNDHYFKGFPRHYPAACRARRVPGVTGAALLVRRAAFLAVGGFSTDYIIGDFEDSDLCLALRAAGHEIGYEPAAELFHFERQSIAGHAGHARSLAGAYNRLLQHRRWDGAIAALMPRFPEDG
jgi:GT2 family glycosyltransferase